MLFERSPFTGLPAGTIQGEGGETGGQSATAGARQESGANTTGQNQSGSASTLPDAIVITIPSGASVQGNPAYEPATAQVRIDHTVAWKNDDSALHTATSGKLFDSSLINPGESYSIAAEKIGAGDHAYSCTVRS
jgi:plastocyanin